MVWNSTRNVVLIALNIINTHRQKSIHTSIIYNSLTIITIYYSTELSKISRFVTSDQLLAETEGWITEFVFLMNIFRKQSALPFSLKSNRRKEKSVVSFTHEQNIIRSQTKLDDIVHEQTIICRQLFAGHVVGSRPMKKKKKLQGMIILSIWSLFFQRY